MLSGFLPNPIWASSKAVNIGSLGNFGAFITQFEDTLEWFLSCRTHFVVEDGGNTSLSKKC